MAKKKEEQVVTEKEDMKAKFQEKLAELLVMGKKKKNILEYQEINDFFKDFPLDPEQMEKVFDFLEGNGIDVLRIQENDIFIAMSDGCPHAGIGLAYNFGWKREEIIEFMETMSSIFIC